MADTNLSAVAALNLVTTASKAGKTVQQVMSAKSTGFDFKNRRMTADCQRLMPMKLLKECHRR